jgi:hypothetical protein
MSIYRTQAIVTKPSSYKEELFFYVPIGTVDKSFLYLHCFICKSSRRIIDNYYDFLFFPHKTMKLICLPEKRVNIRGFFKRERRIKRLMFALLTRQVRAVMI